MCPRNDHNYRLSHFPEVVKRKTQKSKTPFRKFLVLPCQTTRGSVTATKCHAAARSSPENENLALALNARSPPEITSTAWRHYRQGNRELRGDQTMMGWRIHGFLCMRPLQADERLLRCTPSAEQSLLRVARRRLWSHTYTTMYAPAGQGWPLEQSTCISPK